MDEREPQRRGDLVLEDRGFLDGATLTHLKGERGVDVIIPLKWNMHAYREAVALAEMERRWEPHPSRRDQQIAFVRGIEHVWDECLCGTQRVCHPLLQCAEACAGLHRAGDD
ncbi:MAG: transposase [Acidobacteria bacterium]|nr:transposase [Acidobacteriota bacterium]